MVNMIYSRIERDKLYSLQEIFINEREDGNVFKEINSIIDLGKYLTNGKNLYENKLFYNFIFKNRLPFFDFQCRNSTSCCKTFDVNVTTYDIYKIFVNTGKEYSEFCQLNKSFYNDYTNSKLKFSNLLKNKYSYFIKLKSKNNAKNNDIKNCIFLNKSLCSINHFKPQTCKNFPFSNTNMKINFSHKNFLEARCNYILKDNSMTINDINNLIKGVFFNSYLFKLDSYIATILYKYIKRNNKTLNEPEIIKFFVEKYLIIKDFEEYFLSKINFKNIEYILTYYDIEKGFKIIEIISEEENIYNIKNQLKKLNIRKYKNYLIINFNGIKVKILLLNKLNRVIKKNFLYSKKEYLYYEEKSLIDTISIDVAYIVSDNLYNLIKFAIKQNDINSINQYLKDFKTLINKFQDNKIFLNFIKILKKLYFESLIVSIKDLRNEINNYMEKFENNDYYVNLLQIQLDYLETNDNNKLLNEIILLVEKFKDKELKIYKYLIKNKIDIYPINNYIYERLRLYLTNNANLNKDDIFNLLDSLNKEYLNINNTNILLEKFNYYLASCNYEKLNQIIIKTDNSVDSLLSIADIYLSNDLLENSFLYLQKCIELVDDKSFLQDLLLNITIDMYIKSNKQLNALCYLLDNESREKFYLIITNKFEREDLNKYINYKINKNTELLKNFKLKYFHFDKKSSFIEIVKTIFENLLFEEIISNNDNQNYLNSLIEISKGNFETNNDRIKLLLDLYKEENYKTIDEFVLKL